MLLFFRFVFHVQQPNEAVVKTFFLDTARPNQWYPMLSFFFQGSQEESGLQFVDMLHLGNNGRISSLVQLTVNSIDGVVGAVFRVVEERINQFVIQIRNHFTRRFPIEYPIIGTMSWKISNLSLRLHDLENPGLLSSPFYSSLNGYKMRLRLDFYQTDMNRRDTVLSLSLLIVEGENDKSLVWPFTGLVTFGLLNFGTFNGIYERLQPERLVMRDYSDDQDTMVVHYSWTLHQSEKNIEFIKDDCLFIKCTVNVS